MSEGMKAAKATPADVDEMRDFLFELQEMVDNQENDIDDIGTFCHAHFNARCGRHFQRILFGYDTLIENACDPSLSYLDWKPEIKEAITAFQRCVHADGTKSRRISWSRMVLVLSNLRRRQPTGADIPLPEVDASETAVRCPACGGTHWESYDEPGIVHCAICTRARIA